ncbi:hypothetical protein M427DRAFT_32259 [Gonapodya prolifera JEL478]|uniref:F-box domain-containing protein n=1 Tax=Gonapodya prolifera (strain JEL478) TaxID=1344416 RepID=A0A139AFN7_GONPJ|nr:hypothetical protein M427DRAFT_32259 [Gonapodya prolifera JEL478]|eukprot:KXS15570.1 hypothetical protein M427DRAFT_32259 [Gonapodya prolifera JEL478]
MATQPTLPSELIHSVLTHLPLSDVLRVLFASVGLRGIALPVARRKIRDRCAACEGGQLGRELSTVFERQPWWGRRGLGRFVAASLNEPDVGVGNGGNSSGPPGSAPVAPLPPHLLPPALALVVWDIIRVWRFGGGDRLISAWSSLPPPQTFERGWRVFAPFLSGLNLPLTALTRIISFMADESANAGVGLSGRSTARLRESVADLSGTLADTNLSEEAIRYVWWNHSSTPLSTPPLRFLGHSSTIFPGHTPPDRLIPSLIWLGGVSGQMGFVVPGVVVANMGWARGTVSSVAKSFCSEIIADVRRKKRTKRAGADQIAQFVTGLAYENIAGSLGRTLSATDLWGIAASILTILLEPAPPTSRMFRPATDHSSLIPVPDAVVKDGGVDKEMAIAVFDGYPANVQRAIERLHPELHSKLIPL